MIAMWLGDWSLTVVPGSDLAGVAAVLLGIVVSVQLGRGRVRQVDGPRRVTGLRVLLLALNCFAVAMIPVVLNGLDHGQERLREDARRAAFREGFRSAVQQAPVKLQPGLYADGRQVSQVFPYDAKGRPLVGVQLFDQTGQPIDVAGRTEFDDGTGDGSLGGKARVYYPWTNGATQLLNVFPIPTRVQDLESPSATAFTEKNPPSIEAFPRPSVPPISLPGMRTGRVSADR
jgi:hypothetical protein